MGQWNDLPGPWGWAALGFLLLGLLTTDTSIPARWALLRGLHPQAQPRFLALLLDIERRTGWTVILTSGYRSFDEQAALHLKNSANAAAGRSGHNYGLALDFNLTKGGVWLRKADTDEAWAASGAPAIIREHGFLWGGDYASYQDPIHIDLTNRYPVAALYTAALKRSKNKLRGFDGRTVKLAA